jgi:hypothetical protein
MAKQKEGSIRKKEKNVKLVELKISFIRKNIYDFFIVMIKKKLTTTVFKLFIDKIINLIVNDIVKTIR